MALRSFLSGVTTFLTPVRQHPPNLSQGDDPDRDFDDEDREISASSTPTPTAATSKTAAPLVTLTTPEGEEVDVVSVMESGTNSARKARPTLSELHKRLTDLPEGLSITTVPTRVFINDADEGLKFFVPTEMQFDDVLKNLIVKHSGEIATAADEEDVIHLSDIYVEGLITHNADLVYRSVVEHQLLPLENFITKPKSRKRSRLASSFSADDDELLFVSVIKDLDDGHYEPGDNLFKRLIEKQIFQFEISWKDLKERYAEIMEEPVFKKRKFDFTIEIDSVRSPRKNITPPKKGVVHKTVRSLGKDDSEAYKSLHPEAADSENGSESNETEDDDSFRDDHHQPQMDDSSVDGSVQGSVRGDSDQDAEDFSLEQVEQTVEKLQRMSGKDRQAVLHAIYICNGEVKIARDFLLRGSKAVMGKTWSKEEDKILLGDNQAKIGRMEKERGVAQVKSRIAFLLECS